MANTTAIAATPAPAAQGPFRPVEVVGRDGKKEVRYAVNDERRAFTEYSIFIREGNLKPTMMWKNIRKREEDKKKKDAALELIEYPAPSEFHPYYGKPGDVGECKEGPKGLYRMYIPLTGEPGKVGVWRTMTKDELKQAGLTR